MQIETFLLAEHDRVPNNPKLPVIFYRKAVSADSCEATAVLFEDLFARHGWPAQWRDGIFDYHHYHSTAHEVLGVASGSARLTIGGPGGRALDVAAGDALLLPAGTGHRAKTASEDFLVVGGYPEGQEWDICREAPTDADRARMLALPFPMTDPIKGIGGPVSDCWRSSIRLSPSRRR